MTTIDQITDKIIERSRDSRAEYLSMIAEMRDAPPAPDRLSCSNWAHVVAAESEEDKKGIPSGQGANIGIVTAYNDMLSAHQPFANYPNIIKLTARSLGATAQVAGGVPAMCDGVTQGQPGMELSLFSREVVAMATAVGLSHNMFDGNMFLGVCDKIVPGLLIGALQFGQIPSVFVPAGPMASGIPNKEKARTRQKFAAGEVGEEELLAVESASYHSPGTCTFYGTANTNQMMVEMLGVQMAGASFVPPDSPLREALTRAAVEKLVKITDSAGVYRPLYDVVTEKSLVNAIVGLLATGGSTNHSMHIVAVAKAAGIDITWHDMDKLSRVTPLLAKVYPNGQADVNHFHNSGGMAYMVKELRLAGLLNEDVVNIMGEGLSTYEIEPSLNENGEAQWLESVEESRDLDVLRPHSDPFSPEGGLRVTTGNLGTGIIKISAVAEDHRVVEAPCEVFDCQEDLTAAFQRGELNRDVIAVVRFQGPSANGMPELHKMTPPLAVLLDKGFKVALVTDGRMSGASGKVPAAIHISPGAITGGPLCRLRSGDLLRFDANEGVVKFLGDEVEFASRTPAKAPEITQNLGRNLFAGFRNLAGVANEGASVFAFDDFSQ